MAGKSYAHEPVWVSTGPAHELTWFANHLNNSDGIHVIHSREWGGSKVDLTLFCEACPLSMGYWLPSLSCGFQCHVNTHHGDGIFNLEALTVLLALHWVLHDQDLPHGACITLYTDNFNTVNIFNTLYVQPLYNPILITAVDLLYSFNVQLRVLISLTRPISLLMPCLVSRWTLSTGENVLNSNRGKCVYDGRTM